MYNYIIMLIISSSALFQVGMITGLEPCSRFNTVLLRVHMVTGLGSCGRFILAHLRVHMITDLGMHSRFNTAPLRDVNTYSNRPWTVQ